MPLLESRAPAEPLALFRRWYLEAQRAGAPQPDAMTLATAGAGFGMPRGDALEGDYRRVD